MISATPVNSEHTGSILDFLIFPRNAGYLMEFTWFFLSFVAMLVEHLPRHLVIHKLFFSLVTEKLDTPVYTVT